MTPPGFLPADRTQATLEDGKQVPFVVSCLVCGKHYPCQICGQWHVYPTPCPVRHVNEESAP